MFVNKRDNKLNIEGLRQLKYVDACTYSIYDDDETLLLFYHPYVEDHHFRQFCFCLT